MNTSRILVFKGQNKLIMQIAIVQYVLISLRNKHVNAKTT